MNYMPLVVISFGIKVVCDYIADVRIWNMETLPGGFAS